MRDLYIIYLLSTCLASMAMHSCLEDTGQSAAEDSTGKGAEGGEPLLQLPWKELHVDWQRSGLTIGAELLKINEVINSQLLYLHPECRINDLANQVRKGNILFGKYSFAAEDSLVQDKAQV